LYDFSGTDVFTGSFSILAFFADEDSLSESALLDSDFPVDEFVGDDLPSFSNLK